jgi:hypothetical protein
MTNAISFTNEQFLKLQRLLDCDPGILPDAGRILTALEKALAVMKASGDRALSLSASSPRRSRNPLLEDARRRAVEAILSK